KAFIKRVNSLEDRRFVSVHLTDTGRDLCERIKPILEEVNGQIIEDVSSEELVTLRKILQKIDKNVE
ncbi:MarR family transcriptional regulator, partial [Paraburkholderia sp. SIMBA_055]